MDNILFFTDLYSGSRVPLLSGAQLCAAEHNVHVQIVELSRTKVSLAQTLAFWKPIGCIVEGSSHINPVSEDLDRLPVVYLDANARILSTHPSFTVMNDNAGIADRALKTLLQAGCEHFAFVGWTRGVNWSTIRLDTFKTALAELGKTCHEFLDPWSIGDAAELTARIGPWLKTLPRLCGLFAANDDVAAIVLNSCRAIGIVVPDDLAVIGVDNSLSVCEATTPSLSSIQPDFQRGGYLATELLLRRVANPDLSQEHLLVPPVGVNLRQSTRRLSKQNPRIAAALELIRRQAVNGLKASDVVKSLGMSERLAETQFKSATGRRITEEITEVRLTRVLELLRQPRQNISSIAQLCGWDSDVYLKRLFKARYGMTMREWRSRNK